AIPRVRVRRRSRRRETNVVNRNLLMRNVLKVLAALSDSRHPDYLYDAARLVLSDYEHLFVARDVFPWPQNELPRHSEKATASLGVQAEPVAGMSMTPENGNGLGRSSVSRKTKTVPRSSRISTARLISIRPTLIALISGSVSRSGASSGSLLSCSAATM